MLCLYHSHLSVTVILIYNLIKVYYLYCHRLNTVTTYSKFNITQKLFVQISYYKHQRLKKCHPLNNSQCKMIVFLLKKNNHCKINKFIAYLESKIPMYYI